MDRLPPALATATRLRSLSVSLCSQSQFEPAAVTVDEVDGLLAALPRLCEFGLGGGYETLPLPVLEHLQTLPPHFRRLDKRF